VAGKLNCDQFALAMHLVQQKLLHGIDPPMQLSPDMIPPSLQVIILLESLVITERLKLKCSLKLMFNRNEIKIRSKTNKYYSTKTLATLACLHMICQGIVTVVEERRVNS